MTASTSLPSGIHVADRAKDEAVRVAVEVVFGDELGRDGDGVGADDHRAEERFLGVEVVRLHVTTVALDDAGGHDAAPLCGAAWAPRHSATTMTLTDASTPSKTSMSTMNVPRLLMGSSRRILCLSTRTLRALQMASATSAEVTDP